MQRRSKREIRLEVADRYDFIQKLLINLTHNIMETIKTIEISNLDINKLAELVADKVVERIDFKQEDTNIIRGYKAVAEELKIGERKIRQLKKAGLLDDAMIQHGRTILFNKQKVLEVLRKEGDNVR